MKATASIRSCLLMAVGAAWLATSGSAWGGLVVDDDFSLGDHGWTAGFADYPPAADLVGDYRPRPANLGGAGSLYISGSNHSDDLFMFHKKRVMGLAPNRTYDVVFEIEFASQYPDGSIGIGGSPANSVYLKAGSTLVEPESMPVQGYYLMNIDKGNQASEGADTDNLGDIGKPDDGNWDYVLVHRDNKGNPFAFTTDGTGQAWLLFGTDSGFEGTTSLYYTHFKATFIPEPASLALLAFGGPAVLRRRRRNV